MLNVRSTRRCWLEKRMARKLRIVYAAHSLRSDWNNGNAHFLRGLMRALAAEGHCVRVLEADRDWSIDNLLNDPLGPDSLGQFKHTYPDLDVQTYGPDDPESTWEHRLADAQIVIMHEWNPPDLADRLLRAREQYGYKLLFHDTHHRASSSPQQMGLFGLKRFDGIIAFGDALRKIYQERFGMEHVWVLHEAADVTVFKPFTGTTKTLDAVWIGNWGEGERSDEIRQFFLTPARALAERTRFRIYGVRYPQDGLQALAEAGVEYGGYLPNLDAPATYAAAQLTVHIPRQQYSSAMTGIPTIRVFEALACGIPLISAPWHDTEHLFREGDFRSVSNAAEMETAMRDLLSNQALAAEQVRRGLETVLARHTCGHRAQELIAICEELLA